ncbi:MAG TPA: GspE/PulE family protein [Acidobacteriota bacterium]
MNDLNAAATLINGRRGAEPITERSRADEEAAARELAARSGLPYMSLEAQPVDHELFTSIPVDLMFRYNFVPLRREKGSLVIAVSDPTDVLKLDELEALLGARLAVQVTTPSGIGEVLKKSESSQRVLEQATESFRFQLISEDEGGAETISIEKLEAEASPIIKLIDLTIFNALQRRASDVHIETRERDVTIKYRIDGVLYPAMEPLDRNYHSPIISRIKVMSELDIAEKRIPQDGRFKLRYKNRNIDFRVSIMPTVNGEDAVIRILDKESINQEFANLRLDVLGFEGEVLRRLRRHISQPYGMLLVTGPTGSGKTTTLYAALNEIKTEEDKIVTIEDPVEYQLVGVTQIPVNEKKGLTFARGLRSILRHDPDKIMVGEIRDPETAQIAIQSALTGHLVFTTVHANNVIDVLGRFLNMGVEPYNFVAALNCILAQRLVRIICPNCKVLSPVPAELLEESGLDPEQYRDQPFAVGRGCIECHGTGHKGRTAIYELLDLTDPIRELILDKRPGSEIKRLARSGGMQFLRESALKKAFECVSSLAEVNKVTFVESF